MSILSSTIVVGPQCIPGTLRSGCNRLGTSFETACAAETLRPTPSPWYAGSA